MNDSSLRGSISSDEGDIPFQRAGMETAALNPEIVDSPSPTTHSSPFRSLPVNVSKPESVAQRYKFSSEVFPIKFQQQSAVLREPVPENVSAQPQDPSRAAYDDDTPLLWKSRFATQNIDAGYGTESVRNKSSTPSDRPNIPTTGLSSWTIRTSQELVSNLVFIDGDRCIEEHLDRLRPELIESCAIHKTRYPTCTRTFRNEPGVTVNTNNGRPTPFVLAGTKEELLAARFRCGCRQITIVMQKPNSLHKPFFNYRRATIVVSAKLQKGQRGKWYIWKAGWDTNECRGGTQYVQKLKASSTKKSTLQDAVNLEGCGNNGGHIRNAYTNTRNDVDSDDDNHDDDVYEQISIRSGEKHSEHRQGENRRETMSGSKAPSEYSPPWVVLESPVTPISAVDGQYQVATDIRSTETTGAEADNTPFSAKRSVFMFKRFANDLNPVRSSMTRSPSVRQLFTRALIHGIIKEDEIALKLQCNTDVTYFGIKQDERFGAWMQEMRRKHGCGKGDIEFVVMPVQFADDEDE